MIRKLTTLALVALLLPLKSFAFDFPKDLPTFEALMALHKAVKKDEDQALARIATSFGEQSLVTKGAEKFNDVRSTPSSTTLTHTWYSPLPYPRPPAHSIC